MQRIFRKLKIKKGVKTLEIVLKGKVKEIAALVLQLQERQSQGLSNHTNSQHSELSQSEQAVIEALHAIRSQFHDRKVPREEPHGNS